MPSDRSLKAMNGVHRGLLKISRGKFGWIAANMPVLELTTTGRKSGRAHSVMLTSPHQLGDQIVIVASRGGDDKNPDWFLNLKENPNVFVTTKNVSRTPMSARIASAKEHTDLWPTIVDSYPNYDNYQKKTVRKIPLVLLEPQDRKS